MAKIKTGTFDQAETQTLIAALVAFGDEMKVAGALGSDEIGESARIGYLHHCYSLLRELTNPNKEE